MVRAALQRLSVIFIAISAMQLAGCLTHPTARFPASDTAYLDVSAQQAYQDGQVQTASHSESIAAAPPRIRDIEQLGPWAISLDDAVKIALQNNSVVRGSGGRVLGMPDGVQTPLDPATVRTDPNIGPEAALSAFDTRFESGLLWNGGGRSVGSAFSSGPFGIFSQPTTLAKLGIGRTLTTGTELTIGGVGGYDSQLATGFYAAFGGTLRHPLLRGSGRDFNRIAGPNGQPGAYRGVWIAQLNTDKAHLELERAVRDLIRDVASTYWELYFAYENLKTKRVARENARQSWEREKTRVAEQASPADFEAIARQQFYTAEAAVKNAVSGTGRTPSGVYAVEIKLRSLLGLPVSDGKLIRPSTTPLRAEFLFDWAESTHLAQTARIELRKQKTTIERRKLELRAARNLTWPQVDLVGQYRRLADDPAGQDALFSQALQGWQIGVEVKRAIGNRRENAGLHNAELRLRRDRAVLQEQQRLVMSQLRIAFTELDRSFGVTQALAVSRDAANARLQAQAKRHAAGQTDIESLLRTQTRATEAATSFQRSLVDYNLAFIKVHFARGTLLDMLGVGFSEYATADEIQFTGTGRSPFAAGQADRASVAELPRSPRQKRPAHSLRH